MFSLLVFVWLLVGLLSAGQRGYLTSVSASCRGYWTIVLTVAAGPVNYLGVRPSVSGCHFPDPTPPSTGR
ncbi:hypothetical protein ACWDSJ_01800 [Nocardia sp. NPDC003482]